MASIAVRVSQDTYEELKTLAAERGTALGAVIEELLKERRERIFWDAFDAAYTVLREDPTAWAKELAERQIWDAAAMDGLHDDPYDDPGTIGICEGTGRR